ncbi:DUF1592 domain-containing protein [Verrucomicrobiales bacterium BCK34]|nr:DUF1592 domain-containing protein [Verrucomicrobiales bacterium BCK34]
MKKHCADCHNEEKAKGKFELSFLGDAPDSENLERWLDCLDLVTAEEMPPEDENHLTGAEREKIVAYLDEKVRSFESGLELSGIPKPRRLNNREFENSIRDVLMIEDIGTHQPTDNLIGDSLFHGFDTHADTLGFSRFHLDQYIEAVRKIVDATILSGEKPELKRYEITPEKIIRANLKQNGGQNVQRGKDGVFDFLDPRLYGYFEDFETVPETGRYKITIRCTGKDRLIYDSAETGFYDGDPIQLSVHLGNRVRTYDLPDEEIFEIQLDEWLASGSRLQMYNPTDAFRMKGNGNFKFQYAIGAFHTREHNPEKYEERVARIKKSPRLRGSVNRWPYWVTAWEGARPQVFGAVIEGPYFESWPPKRQVALLGEDPQAKNAATVLEPIAARAWRRPVHPGELDKIIAMVKSAAETQGEIEAFKEGVVAILVSPAFLMLNFEAIDPADRFASKFSYFLKSTLPDEALREKVLNGKLNSFDAVKKQIQSSVEKGEVDDFLRAFPTAWLELNDINFMSPDPEHYLHYHKKRLSEDMVNEALAFFRHAVEENIPVTEFLSADYSFINADLAKVYGVDDVPEDSKLRKYTFTDGRRGGLLGMGAFLTSTADSLATSPIHRAVYVMENFMGIHPTPPPPDVVIKEPDVREAKTIKEILAAHVSDENCASCHESIDPWGYAFENFDPTGAWRDEYLVPVVLETDEDEEPVANGKKEVTLPIDSSAKFRNGAGYRDITEFREEILSDVNRDRFVRCFIEKLLTYANGEAPEESDFVAIDDILKKSAEHDHRIVETIAAVVDSPLFRGREG